MASEPADHFYLGNADVLANNEKLTDKARQSIYVSRADNTIDAYRSDWKDFCDWCAYHDETAFPASPETIVNYINDLADNAKANTIARRISALTENFAAAGITDAFVQDNQSCSHRGVLRGLHFQKRHQQAKLVRAISGEIFDVAVDLRRGSATYGRWVGVVLSAENRRQLYIPRGFAHGFQVLSEQAVFAYKCGDVYHPEDEGGLRYDDADISIVWPGQDTPILSEKDQNWPALRALGIEL